MERVAVVILNWNGVGHLEKFLPSVISNSTSARIFVADNGSQDDSVSFVESSFPTIGIIKLAENYGFAEGYNKALAHPSLSGYEYYVLLNSDVETPAGWLEPLISALDADPLLGVVAPKILSFNDKPRFEYAGASGGFIDALGYPFCRGRILSHVEKDRGQYDDARQCFWASGACFAVRSQVFEKCGGFDGDFFAHMEEIDLCWRIQAAGHGVGVVPASYVYHLGGGTLDSRSTRKLYLNYRNNLYMLYKNLPLNIRGRVIALRMIADGLSAIVYLLTFRIESCRTVWRAHRDFRKNKPVLAAKRKEFVSVFGEMPRRSELSGIYNGSIVARYIFGGRKFGSMM